MMKFNKAILGAVLLSLVTHSCEKGSNLAGKVIENKPTTGFIERGTGRRIPSLGGLPVIDQHIQTNNPVPSLSDFERVTELSETPSEKMKKKINTFQIQQALTPPPLPEVSVGDNFSVSTPLNSLEDLFLPHLSTFPANSSVKKVTPEWQPTQTLPRQGVETGTPVRGLW